MYLTLTFLTRRRDCFCLFSKYDNFVHHARTQSTTHMTHTNSNPILISLTYSSRNYNCLSIFGEHDESLHRVRTQGTTTSACLTGCKSLPLSHMNICHLLHNHTRVSVVCSGSGLCCARQLTCSQELPNSRLLRKHQDLFTHQRHRILTVHDFCSGLILHCHKTTTHLHTLLDTTTPQVR